ncbi:hypothetical protein LTR62_006671 [Meristemomyces frigidus]|uniref:EamA domain-containing protein n=1 Tax=Meristemomyces frigidus TaxID=1508187 RepID=A0AAN7TNR8_9PEZI|nr:hypothetical protein LTR62_006671 [Meristemomyces frigidus]
MGPADRVKSPDAPPTYMQGSLLRGDVFPPPASPSDELLDTPTLSNASNSANYSWTTKNLVTGGGDTMPSEPDAATASAPLLSPPTYDYTPPEMDMLVGGALAPTHSSAPERILPKSGPGLRLPSFEALGIASPHPDRFGRQSFPESAMMRPDMLSLQDATAQPPRTLFTDQSCSRGVGAADLTTCGAPQDETDSVGGRAVHGSVHQFVSTLTPPAEHGEMDWSSIAAASNQPMESPAIVPGVEQALSAGGGYPAGSGASQHDMFAHADERDDPCSWLDGALQVLLESLRTAPLPSNPLRVLSHALPSPSSTGHMFPRVLESIHDSTPGSPTEWINVFHAIPGRFNLADLPTSPPSTPGPPLGGEDYFTQKVFDSAVPITDYQGDLSSLPRSPRPIVPPSSINIAIVERYIPPTSANEFADMFNTHGPSILVDRLVELSPNNGCLTFIYPTKTGGQTFMRDYVDPLWAPLLRSICVSHGLSSDVGKSLGTMSAVERLLEHDELERSIKRLCNTLNRQRPGLRRPHHRKADFNLVYSAKRNVCLSREVWARDWWTKQEKPRIRDIVVRYSQEAQKKSSNEYIERPATATELIQQLLDGMVNKAYAEGQSPSEGIEVGVTGQPGQHKRNPSLLPPDHFHDGESATGSSSDLVHLSRDPSRQASPFTDLPYPDQYDKRRDGRKAGEEEVEDDGDSDFEHWGDEDDLGSAGEDMPSELRRPSIRSGANGGLHSPLLQGEDKYHDPEDGRRSNHRRSSRFRERDPASMAAAATRKRYTYAAIFLGISLVSFAVQTETAVYIQHNLGWKKAYCMLYFTHGSWSLLWPTQLLILRLQKWKQPWPAFWRRHVQLLRQTGQMIEHRSLSIPSSLQKKSPVPYFLRTTAYVTCALTIAGGSWYVAVDLTTASDLTAIYNCSAFFAYAFAIPMLHEKLRLSKVVAVAIAIVGVLVVAYGDSGSAPAKHGSKSGGGSGGPHAPEDESAGNRLIGNLVIGVGSVLYGFYEVLYKKVACPPDGCSPGRGMLFANTFGSLMGSFTLLVLWIPLPILHITGIETFELPQGKAAWMLLVSVSANAIFSGSFLVLISLTSPVLSSVAALLTIFLVALCDQMLPPPLYSPLTGAAIAGGVLIIAAFGLLSWATFREMKEERGKHGEEASVMEDDESEDDL